MVAQDLPAGFFYLVAATACVFLGLYHFTLYRPRRELVAHFWLGPLGISTGCYIIVRSPYAWIFGGENTVQIRQFECIFVFATAALFFQFMKPIVTRRLKQALFAVQMAQLVLIPAAVVLPDLAMNPMFLFWWQVAVVPLGVAVFLVITRQAWFGYPDAKYMAAGMLFLWITYLLDIAMHRGWIQAPELFPFGAAALFISLSLSIASRVPRLYVEFDTLRDNMERRVKERTQELAERTREMIESNAKLTERSQDLTVANQRLMVRTSDLAEANLAKSRFLANMSHELRTPLNAIIGYSEMILEESEEKGAGAHPDLVKISAAGKNLLSIISEILDLSKIEAGKMELNLEKISVGDLINEVVSTVKPLMEKNSNAFELRKGSYSGPMFADAAKVRQILLNLLSNAAKFTERGLVTLEVKREPVDGIDSLYFRVVDSGIGITPEQLKKLFQAFTQADSSTTKRFGGTGLGLAISQKLCQMMGGEINVESQFGIGSTFTFRLPVTVLDPHSEPQAARQSG